MQSALPASTSEVCLDGTQSITTKIPDDDGCKEKT
jgi:hypothetical protein